MRKNIILFIIVLFIGFLLVVSKYDFEGGAFLPLLSFLIAVLITSLGEYRNYKSKQLFFIASFTVLIILSSVLGATYHTGALLTTNSKYFITLNVIPLSIIAVLGIIVYLYSLKNRDTMFLGLSTFITVYFALASVVVFFATMLHALSGHSV